jgi:hypothetical protein
MALTQLPAVEPLCGGFCGELPRSALLSTVFLNIYYCFIEPSEFQCKRITFLEIFVFSFILRLTM